MPTNKDYIPMNWAAFAVWFGNFVVQLKALAAKYVVAKAKVDELEADNAWVQFWADKQEVSKQQKK